MLKPLVPKFRLDLSARLKGIAKKQVPAKLEPIVAGHSKLLIRHWLITVHFPLVGGRLPSIRVGWP